MLVKYVLGFMKKSKHHAQKLTNVWHTETYLFPLHRCNFLKTQETFFYTVIFQTTTEGLFEGLW